MKFISKEKIASNLEKHLIDSHRKDDSVELKT